MPAKIPVSLNGIEFDALIDEGRSFNSTIPQYPVEDGYSVSDAIILSPESLSMTLYVTDTPVTWVGRHGSGFGRTQQVLQELENLYFKKLPVTVTTSEKIFENMGIESLSINKTVETGYAREIPISLKKIVVTTAKTTTIPDSYGKSGTSGETAGSANTSKGQTEGDADTQGTKSSILYSIAKSAKPDTAKEKITKATLSSNKNLTAEIR